MKRHLDPKKIIIYQSHNHPGFPGSGMFIKYEGVGGDTMPASMWNQIINDRNYGNSIINNPSKILFEAIKHSQYIPFEEIKTPKL